MIQRSFLLATASLFLAGSVLWSGTSASTYRVYEGLTVYFDNTGGGDFELEVDVRDLNVFSEGPRELMVKVYGPSGDLQVREFIPDDGITTPLFPDRIAGWDHELQYYANLYAKGTKPSFRWSEWFNPDRLAAIAARTFSWSIDGGEPGVYRVVFAGTRDHVVSLRTDRELSYGLVGHPTWIAGSGDMLRKSYIFVPEGSTGVFFAVAEPDLPSTRTFTLTAPDGTVLFDGKARGGYQSGGGEAWQHASTPFPSPGAYDGQLLTLEVSEGEGAFLVKTTLQQPRAGVFRDYVGMGSLALYADSPELAMTLRGGTFIENGELYWHPFQARFQRWLRDNPMDGSEAERELHAELTNIANLFRLLGPSDARGALSWTNLAYAMGYYGFRVFRPGWVLMNRDDVPEEARELIREGLIISGDRLSMATGIEAINGNAFAQIPVALWYAHRATGDELLEERFEIFWERWKNEGWGRGTGLSPSGDAQEHLAHDSHYGSYLLDNWRGGTWVNPGILDDATDDPRFQEVIERYRDLYSYLYTRDGNGRPVAANPWSSRTHMHPSFEERNWRLDGREWKGDPGPDFTVSVNDGDEWFAARRPSYYFLSFHGRLAPDWLSQSFPGQCGFGGGAICQLTVPGKGVVLASTLRDGYGRGMHPSQWRDFSIHSVVGRMWDGRPLVSGISDHLGAASLEGNKVSSEGEVRNAHVRVARSYTFGNSEIACEVRLSESPLANVITIWIRDRMWSEVAEAYEMIPFMPQTLAGEPTEVTVLDGSARSLGELTENPVEGHGVRINRGGFGVVIHFDEPRRVHRGARNTVMIELVDPDGDVVRPEEVGMSYRIIPFGQ